MEFESICKECQKYWIAEGCDCRDKCHDLKNEKMLFSNTVSSKATRPKIYTNSTFGAKLDELRLVYLKATENLSESEKIIVYNVFEFLKNFK